MNWTQDQQKVIDLRNRNILVSAAAGSGKTAVLVARIISMISEGDEPIDIDRLLIVTFTNAAAAEMRERIGAAIEKKIQEMPGNQHLQKQITLIHSAQITTIHSFCLNVIRNYFNTIDLDPSFRIADEAELTLLKSDVIGELIEKYYDEGKEEFLDFIECFSAGKTDEAIENLVLKLHSFSMSYPWPEDWLEEKKHTFSITTLEEMMSSDWMMALLTDMKSVVEDMIQRNEDAIHICEEPDGPAAYLPALRSDAALLADLANLQDYRQYREVFSELTFARLSGKREEGVDEEKKSQVKSIRDEIKTAIGDLKLNYFFQSDEEMLEDIQAMRVPMEVLINLTKDFGRVYAEKKVERNVVDFNDLEHFALRILTQRVDNVDIPTPAADELCEHYAEILIDEYQDSNLVQETILNSISGERNGHPNLFMVGDVKQSIYKFRLARPEIFMHKFETYDTRDSLHQRVDLHKNFRSREIVLNSINFIFEQIMTKKLGNIRYNKDVALYPGADFGELTEGIAKDTEIVLVSVEPTATDCTSSKGGNNENNLNDTDADNEESNQEEEEYTSKELEAKAIARRIKELTDSETGLLIYDKTKQYRRAKYGDIVILLRTMSNWAEVFADTLAAEGITAHTETQSGYFSTLEIRTILNLLKIIDNPRQDIPFTSILRSPIVDLNSNDLAYIRIQNRHISMYEAVKEYISDTIDSEIVLEGNQIENGTVEFDYVDGTSSEEESAIKDKLRLFLEKLEQYRNMVYYLSIHELILKVLDDTGYYDYVSAMPAGDKRKANIDMLIQRAVQFESTSYRGLFHFVRYIEKLDKFDIDFGEAKVVGENDNAIKIMSIHKSKGLEFPIVFVAGMGKNFNNQDSKSKLLIHPDLGLGPDYLDPLLRVKAPTLVKKVIQRELVLDNLGEELRVLYVAMTRAKEKLILTGGVKKLEDKLAKWVNSCAQNKEQLLFSQLSRASTYLDWIIPAANRQGNETVNIKKVSYEELFRSEVAEQIFKKVNQDELIHWNNTVIYDEQIYSEIKNRMEYQYPYRAETNIHTKLTVSELKRLGQMEVQDLGAPLSSIKKVKEIPVPKFMKQEDKVAGSDLGTLYHSVLENMILPKINSREDLEAYLLKLRNTEKISQSELEMIELDKLYAFTTSSIADRMRRADQQNQLFKERQFVMGLKANEINSKIKSDEMVLIQGVIDVYFAEDKQWVLLDYKTDAVTDPDGEKLLINRYQVQLDYYQKALEQLTGIRVKEKVIYSFGLGREIILN